MNHQREPDLFTALHLACAGGLVCAVKALIEGGADVDAVAAEDVMPIHCAESCDAAEARKQILELLRAKGAKRSVAEVLAGLRGGGIRGKAKSGNGASSTSSSGGRRKILVSTSEPRSTSEGAQMSKSKRDRGVVTTILSGFSGSVGMRGKLVSKETKSVAKKRVASRDFSSTQFHFALGGGDDSARGGGEGRSSNSSSSSSSSSNSKGSDGSGGTNDSLIDRVVLKRPAASRKYATVGVDAH